MLKDPQTPRNDRAVSTYFQVFEGYGIRENIFIVLSVDSENFRISHLLAVLHLLMNIF